MSAVALWLVPAEPWHARLTQRIAALAHERQVPPFEPHVTLHVGESTGLEQAADALRELAAQARPLLLRAGPTGHAAERFKALFVGFGDARLHELQALAIRALGLSSGYALQPHLSLLYQQGLARGEREHLAARHDLSGQEIAFDRLALVRPAPARDWSFLQGWDTSLRCTLGA